MADYQFNTNLGPAQQQGTNIADMVNLARGVQAYQQSEQANPLAIKKAQMEIEQANKMNPLAVRKATAEAGTAELGLNEKQTSALYGLAGGVLNDPRLNSSKKEDVLSVLSEAQQRASTFGIPKETVEGVFKPLLTLGGENPSAVKRSISNIVQSGLGATGQQSLQTPQLATVGGAPATYVSGTGTATPLNIGTAGGYTGIGQPPAEQTNKVAGNQGVTQTQMQLPYPVRKAGDIRPFAPNESEDQKAGFTYRDSLNKASSTMSTSLRNIDEVIKQAEQIGQKEWNQGAGFLGTAGRGLSTFLGTEQGVNYKRLSKDLANLQVSLGADTTTDAGKNLIAAANGDITLPPDVLLDIAHRTRADRENIMMQSQGAQIFSQKYGDANIKKFQKDWADNSKDSRVFEAINIYNSDAPQDQKIEKINELFKGVSKETMEKIKRQKANLERLSKTGEM